MAPEIYGFENLEKLSTNVQRSGPTKTLWNDMLPRYRGRGPQIKIIQHLAFMVCQPLLDAEYKIPLTATPMSNP